MAKKKADVIATLHLETVPELADVMAAFNRMTWRPIGTAPKDDTPVLVWDGHVVSCAMREKSCDGWIGCVNGEPANFCDHGGPNPLMDPTHWMPVPDPPFVEPEA